MNLEAIEKRCEAATPGPWTWEETEAEKAGKDWGDIGKTLNAPKGRNVLNAFGYDASYVNVSDADAEFIAHARSDIPALIAEVKRMNAELAAYKKTDLTPEEIFQMRREWRDTEKGLRDSVLQLQYQLAASQRREQAAVKDLLACMYYAEPKNNNTCNFCEKDMAEYPQKCRGRESLVACCPKWRGPQETGKGEAEE